MKGELSQNSAARKTRNSGTYGKSCELNYRGEYLKKNQRTKGNSAFLAPLKETEEPTHRGSGGASSGREKDDEVEPNNKADCHPRRAHARKQETERLRHDGIPETR